MHQDLYRPFGEIKEKIKDKDTLLKKYYYNLFRARSKDEFDQYKTFYKILVKDRAMKEAYAKIAVRRGDLMPSVTDWAMLPYVHDRYCSDEGKRVPLSEFIIMTSIFQANKLFKRKWKGFQGVSMHLVKLICSDFTTKVWSNTVNHMLDREYLMVSPDQEMHRRFLRAMAVTHKHPYLRKIETDTVYMVTPEGGTALIKIMGYQAEFLDRQQHNSDFMSLREMPKEDKIMLNDAKKMLKLWRAKRN